MPTLNTFILSSTLQLAAAGRELAQRIREEDSGEGVISAAIVVLIVAFIGAAMWVAFNQIWQTIETKTTTEINKIGA